jgi:hypothetical protein
MVDLYASQGDSTVTQIFGIAGRYQVTVKKAGFTDVVQQVQVEDAGRGCSVPTPVDVTVSMQLASAMERGWQVFPKGNGPTHA